MPLYWSVLYLIVTFNGKYKLYVKTSQFNKDCLKTALTCNHMLQISHGVFQYVLV